MPTRMGMGVSIVQANVLDFQTSLQVFILHHTTSCLSKSQHTLEFRLKGTTNKWGEITP